MEPPSSFERQSHRHVSNALFQVESNSSHCYRKQENITVCFYQSGLQASCTLCLGSKEVKCKLQASGTQLKAENGDICQNSHPRPSKGSKGACALVSNSDETHKGHLKRRWGQRYMKVDEELAKEEEKYNGSEKGLERVMVGKYDQNTL